MTEVIGIKKWSLNFMPENDETILKKYCMRWKGKSNPAGVLFCKSADNIRTTFKHIDLECGTGWAKIWRMNKRSTSSTEGAPTQTWNREINTNGNLKNFWSTGGKENQIVWAKFAVWLRGLDALNFGKGRVEESVMFGTLAARLLGRRGVVVRHSTNKMWCNWQRRSKWMCCYL